jgi:hypothetical protein
LPKLRETHQIKVSFAARDCLTLPLAIEGLVWRKRRSMRESNRRIPTIVVRKHEDIALSKGYADVACSARSVAIGPPNMPSGKWPVAHLQQRCRVQTFDLIYEDDLGSRCLCRTMLFSSRSSGATRPIFEDEAEANGLFSQFSCAHRLEISELVSQACVGNRRTPKGAVGPGTAISHEEI